MDFDLSTPEGIRAAQKHLKKVSAGDALRLISDNLTRDGGALSFTRSMSGIRVSDDAKRTVDLTFSSEESVERWFGNEVLVHDASSVDLRWLKSGNAPFLWMHNGRDQIGVVETADLNAAEKRCGARCRYANDPEGDKHFARAKDGIERNVSVGYSIQEWERIDNPDDDDEPPTYRATRWKPHEISSVSTPADETVGVGRCRTFRVPDTDSSSTAQGPLSRTSPTMPPVATELTAEQKIEAARLATEAVNAERARINTLNALRRRYDPTGATISDADFARFTDDPAKGELDFRRFLEEKNATAVRATPSLEAFDRTANPSDNYSLVQALRGLVFGNMDKRYTEEDKRLRALSPSCFKPAGERESAIVTTSESVRATRWIGHGTDAQRAQNAQSLIAGGALVGVTFAPEVIEYLRPMPVLQKAGARVMSGITGGPGTIRFPKQTGDIYASWAASQVASTPQQLPFGVLDLSPKRLVAQVRIDKQLLLQESFDIEAYVRNSVNLQFALSYDLAGLIGNGNGMPLGILNTPNIQAGAITFDGPSPASGTIAPQFKNFTGFITKTLAANAGGLGSRSYITSPQSMMNWATVPKAAAGTTITNAAYMLELAGQQGGEQNRTVLGERVEATTYLNTLPTGYTAAGFALPTPDVVIYGPFGEYMFIEWAGIEWVYDPYTQAAADLIVLTARLYVDGGCRQPTAFVTSSNSGAIQYVA